MLNIFVVQYYENNQVAIVSAPSLTLSTFSQDARCARCCCTRAMNRVAGRRPSSPS